jgi:hypothetical protein
MTRKRWHVCLALRVNQSARVCRADYVGLSLNKEREYGIKQYIQVS